MARAVPLTGGAYSAEEEEDDDDEETDDEASGDDGADEEKEWVEEWAEGEARNARSGRPNCNASKEAHPRSTSHEGGAARQLAP